MRKLAVKPRIMILPEMILQKCFQNLFLNYEIRGISLKWGANSLFFALFRDFSSCKDLQNHFGQNHFFFFVFFWW
jgi:hypothetical protein